MNKEFRTTDFYLCGYLLTQNMKLLRAEREGPKRVIFVMQDTPEREQMVYDFYSSKTTVDPLEYKNRIGDLKSLLYNTQGGK